MKDTSTRYGTVTRTFHWLMAVLFLSQFLKFFDRINDGEHWVGQTLVPTHVSIGQILLVLVVLRLVWGLRQGERPRAEGALAPFVKFGHFLLYASMVLMPVTGVLYLLGKGYGLKFFGVQWIARSGVETQWMIDLGHLHSPLAWIFLILVLGHIGITLVHHFVLGDDTLKRMAGKR